MKTKVKVQNWPNIKLSTAGKDKNEEYLTLEFGKKDNEMGAEKTIMYKNEVQALIKKLTEFVPYLTDEG